MAQLNVSLSYGLEFLGQAPRLIPAPALAHCIAAVLGACADHGLGVLVSPGGSGRTALVTDVAAATGRACVVAQCRPELDPAGLACTLMGIASTGFWGCLADLHLLPTRTLGQLALYMDTLQAAAVAVTGVQAASDAASPVHIGSIEMPLRSIVPDFAIFGTVPARDALLAPGTARGRALQALRGCLCPVHLAIPPAEYVAQVLLVGLGCEVEAARAASQTLVGALHALEAALSLQPHYGFGVARVRALLTSPAARASRAQLHKDVTGFLKAALERAFVPALVPRDVPVFHHVLADALKVEDLSDALLSAAAAALAAGDRRRSVRAENELMGTIAESCTQQVCDGCVRRWPAHCPFPTRSRCLPLGDTSTTRKRGGIWGVFHFSAFPALGSGSKMGMDPLYPPHTCTRAVKEGILQCAIIIHCPTRNSLGHVILLRPNRHIIKPTRNKIPNA